MRRIAAHYMLAPSGCLEPGMYVEFCAGGRVAAIEKMSSPDTVPHLEFYSGILVPGFVNAHCHLELSHTRGLVPENTGLAGFIGSIVSKRAASADIIEDAAVRAHICMHQSGVSAAADICNTASSYKAKQKGGIAYRSFIEVFGGQDAAEGIIGKAASIESLMQEVSAAAISPHAPYSTCAEIFRLIGERYSGQRQIFSIHNQECSSENSLFVSRKGDIYDFLSSRGVSFRHEAGVYGSSMDWLLGVLPRGHKYIFVHNTFTSAADICRAEAALGPENCSWVFCPLSNKYISGRWPDFNMWLAQGSNIAIGTDSLASNRQLSIIEELKFIEDKCPGIGLGKLLSWATINGAKALGMDASMGSFDLGKRPGAAVISGADMRNMKLGAGALSKRIV
jgi:aminodeoxyfutalosine deaminase